MSFNNHLAFNISKATPTTSTTNTNTTSTPLSSPPLKSTSTNEISAASSNRGDQNIPLIHNILSKQSNDSSPKIAGVSTTTGLSGVTPTAVSLSDLKDKHDLLDLLGKYDVEHRDSLISDINDDVDLLEEKMKQFEVNKKDVDDGGHPQTSDTILLDESPSEKPPYSAKQTETTDNSITETAEPLAGSSADDNRSPDISSMTVQPYIIPDDSMSAQPYFIADEPVIQINDVPATTDKTNTGDIQGFDQDGDLLNMNSIHPAEELQGVASMTPQPTQPPAVRPKLHRKDSIARASETVNPRERYQQSHKPFDFQIFLNHLKKKSADPIVRYTRSFLVSFSKRANSMTGEQMILANRQFKEFLNEKFKEYEPFASMDDVDLENSGEGVEKLIMNRLYDYCFSPEAIKKFGSNSSTVVFEDLKEDQEFILSVEKFSWILGVHLDVDLDDIARRKHETSKESMNYLDYATEQINKMNTYRAPRDKIICILNSCKIIFNMLKVSNQETNADAFMPLLILLIIKAKTPNLMSNLHYIERYRGEEWLNHGETSYYLSSIQGAISFVRNIKKEDLTIGDDEWNANMEAWEAELRQRPPVVNPIPVRGALKQQETTRPMSSSEVIFASAEMFTKSISNFISPSPQERSPPPPPPHSSTSGGDTQPSEEEIDLVFGQLIEVFPTLDKAILRDIIIMNGANIDQSLDICLTLVSES
ncbi:CIC11C00000005846 [Sungouiella intermedia]|uniref:CIC11C00000005846 n=1 Tax=Sungouiella intermedia TaxID=45354 RepID=A0A1L0BZ82_9ASCO|nr:CIC11C00000005846 [[Candida] intermedia]